MISPSKIITSHYSKKDTNTFKEDTNTFKENLEGNQKTIIPYFLHPSKIDLLDESIDKMPKFDYNKSINLLSKSTIFKKVYKNNA